KENNFALLVALGLSFSVQTVWAADPPLVAPTEPAPVTSRADALFNEGKQLMEQGKFVEACDKLAESDGLDPAIGTLGLLATCHEQQGRIATAWREYTQTAARADAVADERGTFARERAKALELELPKLNVRLAVSDAQAVVLRNGVRLAPDELGVPAPIDPGTYEIIARWEGKPEFRTMVTVTKGKMSEVEIPNPVAPVPKVEIQPPVVVPARPVPMSGTRVGAFVAGGVGLVGFGLATAFAISAASKNSASISIEQSCATPSACQEGKSLRDQAFSAATIANIGVGIGVVGAGTAIILAILPNRTSTAVLKERDAWLVPWAGRDSAGAIFVGHF
ncbi:MAG TPA: hypothetical protein PK156_25710, partial [Polyangium sp.]|nr:hypothetical protein [Polyangium sp.]